MERRHTSSKRRCNKDITCIVQQKETQTRKDMLKAYNEWERAMRIK